MKMKIIESNSLNKYYGINKGVEDVSFDVYKGEIFGFIGPNGSGKSTTIRVMMGLIFKNKGSLKVFGEEVGNNSYKINKNIGYVPSEINFYEKMNIGEFLEYSRELKKYEGMEYLELVEFFDLDLTKKIEELSLGNKKKVAIISALINNPDLIVLDEPTSGLDPLIQQKFYELLRKKSKEGKTIFLSSHNLNEVRDLCERVAIIKDGMILKVAKLSDLKNDRMKKIKIYSSDKINFDLEGVSCLESIDNVTMFNFIGNINDLIKQLTKFKIDNLNIDEEDVEQTFMHYYEKENK